ncbi:MAG TPA: YdeI/OmpD-associated family protein [Gemmatales bacterium]|nr:YdeI/OmpD-associated family protein [Gemmatales bacterium]
MAKRNPEFDVYIAEAAEFARPILKKIRQLFHKAHPQITETMKWSFPHFEYKGLVGSMAAFKQHATFGFWKAALMNDPHGMLKIMGDTTMGAHRLTSVKDLPDDKVIIAYIQQAIELNEAGIKPACKIDNKPKAELVVPGDLAAALKKSKTASATFGKFSYSHRKEYIEWIEEAKRPETRAKRVATTIEQLAEGKSRHWKYQNC